MQRAKVVVATHFLARQNCPRDLSGREARKQDTRKDGSPINVMDGGTFLVRDSKTKMEGKLEIYHCVNFVTIRGNMWVPIIEYACITFSAFTIRFNYFHHFLFR